VNRSAVFLQCADAASIVMFPARSPADIVKVQWLLILKFTYLWYTLSWKCSSLARKRNPHLNGLWLTRCICSPNVRRIVWKKMPIRNQVLWKYRLTEMKAGYWTTWLQLVRDCGGP
jgi:hypothetical protein